MSQHEKINIRPHVTMLSVLKYLEYEVWFALAEFIDNSISSFQQNTNELEKIEGKNYKLIINIEINEINKTITIRDNAGGISEADYQRAFRAAEVPLDNTGLSEFGMGMKSAACWFTDHWRVTSKCIGESVEKRVTFNMESIIENRIEEIDIEIVRCQENLHYTIVELFSVNKLPNGKNIIKVKNHLKSIYREFIRNGKVIIKVANEILTYTDPKVLEAPIYSNPLSEKIVWKRDINFVIDENLSVKGFIAIREKGSTTEAGFALFRRGRVVEGSYDNGFRPESIFGTPNSFRYQRLFGELHLEGFDVAFTKKGIQWDENLDLFLDLLRQEISTKGFPLSQQAEEYRARSTDVEYKKATKSLEHTIKDIEKNLPKIIEELQNTPSDLTRNSKIELPISEKNIFKDFYADINHVKWHISIELSYDPGIKDFIQLGDKVPTSNKEIKQVGIRLSLLHPFMIQFAGSDNSKIEPMLKFAAAFGLSEIIARQSGATTQGEIRRNFNELILIISA